MQKNPEKPSNFTQTIFGYLFSELQEDIVIALDTNAESIKISSNKVLKLETKKSKRNFVRLLYDHESWWDERRANHFASRVIAETVTRVKIIAPAKMDQRNVKATIRKYLNNALKNHTPHLHVADSNQENEWIESVLDHELCDLWLYNASESLGNRTKKLLNEWIIELSNQPHPKNLIVSSSFALKLFGMMTREPSDLDYVTNGSDIRPIPNISFSCHNNHIDRVIIGRSDAKNFFKRKPFRYKNLYIAHPVDILKFKCIRYKQKRLMKDLRDLVVATKLVKHYINVDSVFFLNTTQKLLSRNKCLRYWFNLVEKIASMQDYLRKSFQILNARLFNYRKRAPMVL